MHFAERESIIRLIMSLEGDSLPTRAEWDEYGKELDKRWGRVKVAGVTGIVLAGASLVFPPTIAGAAVAGEEVARNTIMMGLKIIEFHNKYPGIK